MTKSLYGYPVPEGQEMKWERWHEYTDNCTGNLVIAYDIRLEGGGDKQTLGLAVAVTQELVIEEPKVVSLCRSLLMHEIAQPNIPRKREGCARMFISPPPEFGL